MSELFDIPPCDSPRLAWLKQRGVSIIHNRDVDPGSKCEFSGERIYPYCAHRVPARDGGLFLGNEAGYGDTEADAIVALAKANGWRLWHETELMEISGKRQRIEIRVTASGLLRVGRVEKQKKR